METKEERMARMWAEFEQKQRAIIKAEEQSETPIIAPFAVPKLTFNLRPATQKSTKPESSAVEPVPVLSPASVQKPTVTAAAIEANTRDAQGKTTEPNPVTVTAPTRRPSASNGALDEPARPTEKLHNGGQIQDTSVPKQLLSIDTRKRPRDSFAEATSPSISSATPTTGGALTSSSLAGLGRIKKKSRTGPSPVMSPAGTSPSASVDEPVAAQSPLSDTSVSTTYKVDNPPAWYQNIDPNKLPPKLGPLERKIWDDLYKLRQVIMKCQGAKTDALKETLYRELYRSLDGLRFKDVSALALRRKKMLDAESGLPQIIDERYNKGVKYPYYIISDAKGLYNRWRQQIFDGSNIFRGIHNMIKSKDVKGGPSIDPAHKIDWKFHGERHLVNGDWSANQLCAVRDGMHGSAQGGIAGIDGKGATSIIISGEMYAKVDRDELNNIWYSGTPQTKLNETGPTAGTQLLIDSQKTGLPVRVLRSMYAKHSNYAPEAGIRYDGLYKVVDHKLIDSAKKHYVFHLLREEGQDPVRWEGTEKRPTQLETETYRQEMANYGMKRKHK